MNIRYSILALSLLGLTACDPLGDIYKELDQKESVVTKTMDEYVLTAADYESISAAATKEAKTDEEKKLAAAVKTELALNEFAIPDKYIPAIIAKLVPSWGKNSTVGVTFEYHGEQTPLKKEFSTVANYVLTNDDYKAIWGPNVPVNYLSPKHAPEVELPALLLTKYADAEEGDYVVVDYRYDAKDPEFVAGEDLMNEDFSTVNDNDTEIDGWENFDLLGTRLWQGKLFGETKYMQFSANNYQGGKTDSWLISSPVTILSGATLTFDLKVGYFKGKCLTVFVSDKYDGNGVIDEADWTEITSQFNPFPETPTTGYGEFANAGTSKLESFVGKSIYVAFRYRGEGPTVVTTTYQVDNVKVSTSSLAPSAAKPYALLYKFDGSAWKSYSNDQVVLVTPADYTAMGTPGKNGNFSSSDPASKYLPKFLSLKYPYATEGATKIVLYKYYSGSVSVLADEYEVEDNSWTLNNYIVTREKETFLNNGEKWIFDPTITLELSKSEYQIMLDWVAANKPGYLDPKYNTTEYWFGGNSNFLNFHVGLITRRLNDPDKAIPTDDAKAKVYLISQVESGISYLLQQKYPDAPMQMNGVDLYYKIVCKVYDSAANYRYEFRYKSLGKGVFELTGEPIVSPW